jgi:hypothetical protein
MSRQLNLMFPAEEYWTTNPKSKHSGKLAIWLLIELNITTQCHAMLCNANGNRPDNVYVYTFLTTVMLSR